MSESPRYKLVPPVEDGEAWWIIADTQDQRQINFPVVSISTRTPKAKWYAEQLRDSLNENY
jgi:hypothetical protein